MKLSKRIEEFAGNLQEKAFAISDQRSEIAAVLLELSDQFFTLSTDLVHDEAEDVGDIRRRGEDWDNLMSRGR